MIKNTLKRIRLFTKTRKEPYLFLSNILGFYPDNLDLYDLALLHKSSAYKGKDGRYLNNERLEFLGDAILGAIVSDLIYHEFDKKEEGFLTNTRSKIVQRESLNKIAIDLGLDKLIVSAPGTAHKKNNIYGNAFEALIGAIYLDKGYKTTKQFVINNVVRKKIDLNKTAYKEVNFKSRLIEWGQKMKVEVKFELIEEHMKEDNQPIFQTQILINEVDAGVGSGSSKKESQQQASKLALNKIKDTPLFWQTDGNVEDLSSSS